MRLVFFFSLSLRVADLLMMLVLYRPVQQCSSGVSAACLIAEMTLTFRSIQLGRLDAGVWYWYVYS